MRPRNGSWVKKSPKNDFFDHVSIPKIIQSFEPFPFSGCNFVETCRRPGSLQANIGTLCQKSDPDLISKPQISRAEANQLTPLWQLRSFCRKGFVRSSLQNNLWIWVKNRSIYTVDQYNWHDTWSSEMYLPRVLSKNNKQLCNSFCLVSFTKIFMPFFFVRLGIAQLCPTEIAMGFHHAGGNEWSGATTTAGSADGNDHRACFLRFVTRNGEFLQTSGKNMAGRRGSSSVECIILPFPGKY